MSLFKVNKFWSFDLATLETAEIGGEQVKSAILHEPTFSDEDPTGPPQTSSQKVKSGTFVADVGSFSEVGSHEVFVCGSLTGLICVIQVPFNKQPRIDNPINTDAIKDLYLDRQLLAAQRLDFPVIDLKCGFFATTLKQSIAVLGLNQLVVYQVKLNSLDLISTNEELESQTHDGILRYNGNLFSHELEERYRITLLSLETPVKLVVLRANHNATANDNRGSSRTETRGREPYENNTNIVEQMHLPQRDVIFIQYTNQFVKTIIDNKKILGHFRFEEKSSQKSTKCDKLYNDAYKSGVELDQEQDLKRDKYNLDQLGKFVGPSAATFLRDSHVHSLVLSLSDNRLYCLPLIKLISLAKQTVMKRVARNLIGGQESGEIKSKTSSLSYNNSSKLEGHDSHSIIPVNLDEVLSWQFELPQMPLQMIGFSPSNVLSSSTETHSRRRSDQLLVMSRYYLDLFSDTGEHLWSYRFETPIRCISHYVTSKSNPKVTTTSRARDDESFFIVCSDYLNESRSNVTILNEHRIAWSAAMSCKPVNIWRTQTSNISGILAVLEDDSGGACLSVGYLGTHLKYQHEDLPDHDHYSFSQMGALDEQFLNSQGSTDVSSMQEDIFQVDVRLEAYDSWPKAEVKFTAQISPQAHVTFASQDILALLEFDSLLCCELDHPNASYVSTESVQLPLGTYWPDRRDPMVFSGRFKLRTYSNTLDKDKKAQLFLEDKLLPRSLRVNMFLRFSNSSIGHIIQTETFLLPLTLVATLGHIDYSTGINQSLSDVFVNLNGYKRPNVEKLVKVDSLLDNNIYFMCDMFLSDLGDIIDVLDEIIESDLVCRGSNSESSSYLKHLQSKERRSLTMENLNLLAQSLDCRLKFRSLQRKLPMERQQSSIDETSTPVMVSIGFQIVTGSSFLCKNQLKENNDQVVVWLHLCDLSSDSSALSSELAKLHLNEWKALNYCDEKKEIQSTARRDNPLLISIESEESLAAMFFFSHLVERVKTRSIRWTKIPMEFLPFGEKIYNLIEQDFKNVNTINNFLSINCLMHNDLCGLLKKHSEEVKMRYENLKKCLLEEYNKLYISTITSLSIARRLHNLPEDMQYQFSDLTSLTKKYHLSQVGLLAELEKLKRLDYHYSKFPYIQELCVESDTTGGDDRLLNFERIID